VAVCRQLDPVRQPPCQIADENPGSTRVPSADHPCRDQLGVRAERRPRLDITKTRLLLEPLRNVLLLRVAEGPDFVALNPLAGQAAQGLVLVSLAGRAQVHEELEDSPLGNSGHADCGTDAIALDKGGDDLGPASLI
jgi:hypothetical protein